MRDAKADAKVRRQLKTGAVRRYVLAKDKSSAKANGRARRYIAGGRAQHTCKCERRD